MKLISENLFEFQKGLDPVDSLGMGRYKLIKEWLDSIGVTNYTINDDFSIDVKGDVDLLKPPFLNKFSKIPEFIQFNIITRDFDCTSLGLVSLRGCPKIVKGDFCCSYNNLTSLEGFPKIIKGDVFAFDNGFTGIVKDVREICKVKGRVYVS